MCGVVVTAWFAERFAATLHLSIGANRRSAVSTFSHSGLAARHTYVAVTGYVLDLAEGIHSLSLRSRFAISCKLISMSNASCKASRSALDKVGKPLSI